jgi:pimeloyl-ACP methyl ester carboxylesterase
MYKLTPPRVEGTVTVREGRQLGFAEFGREDGRAILWLHGTPGGRRQIPEDARVMAEAAGLRIIGVDRPGTGRSTHYRYPNIADFAPDVTLLMDELGVDQFAVVGLSGGGPYTLGLAYALPHRIPAVAVLGGVVPNVGEERQDGGVVGFLAPTRGALPYLTFPIAKIFQTIVLAISPFGSQALHLYARYAPEGDRRVLLRPDIESMFLDDLIGACRRGIQGPLNDLALFLRPWGFSVADITVPVRWWHGDADNFVPLEQAQKLVPTIPHAQLYLRPGESHLGGLGAAEEVLSVLMEVWDHQAPAPLDA